MPDKYIEKIFLYLLVLSLALHVAFFALIVFLPKQQKPVTQEPYMVELEDLPPSQELPHPSKDQQTRRAGKELRRVPKETAPKGEMERDRIARLPSPVLPPTQKQPTLEPKQPAGRQEAGEIPVREPKRPEGLFKPKTKKLPELAKLFPSADRMANLEESYRKKYGQEVEEGQTRFLNTDDIQFGSFLRRFENAVYGVWRYPSQAAQLGIEGVTPVKITFNRKGEIEKIEILESSGSKLLDDEVMRTLREIGPVGAFPRNYDKDTFNLIAFFQYGIIGGSGRRLH